MSKRGGQVSQENGCSVQKKSAVSLPKFIPTGVGGIWFGLKGEKCRLFATSESSFQQGRKTEPFAIWAFSFLWDIFKGKLRRYNFL